MATVNTLSGPNIATCVDDAEGRRVRKTASGDTEDDVYDPWGHVISAFSATNGSWQRGEVYANGGHLASYFSGTTFFTHADWLGTERVRSTVSATIYSTWTSYPFGEGSCAPNPVPTHFTGKVRDTESGLDYFGARYYASSMGRFMSPDWSAKVEPVPYSKLENPQTLNLYAYVGNNPLSRVDPTGHADIAAECKGQATCNKTLVQTVNIVHQDKKGNTVVDSTLKVTTKFSLTTDAKGNVSASASSTVANVSGLKFSDSQLATMGKDIGTMQQAAVGMGFGPNTTQLVTAVGASESHFGVSPPYAGAPGYMNPAINPMQLTGGNGANMDLNHNIEGGMGVLDWAGRPSDFNPGSAPGDTYYRYSDHSPTTMSNWNAIYGSITEQQP